MNCFEDFKQKGRPLGNFVESKILPGTIALIGQFTPIDTLGNVFIYLLGPFTEVVTSHLRLHNPSDRIVYFKVKTTAPKYYCVRPNSGIMKPNETAVISVMLQPVDQASTLESERTKHKFMIQTAFANSTDTPVETFWKSADPQQVMDSKLRVHFVPGTESTAPSSSETVISDVKETTPVKAPSFGQVIFIKIFYYLYF